MFTYGQNLDHLNSNDIKFYSNNVDFKTFDPTGLIQIEKTKDLIASNISGQLIRLNEASNEIDTIIYNSFPIHKLKTNSLKDRIAICGGSTFQEIDAFSLSIKSSYSNSDIYILSFSYVTNKKTIALGTNESGLIFIDNNNHSKIIKKIEDVKDRIWCVEYDSINQIVVAGTSEGKILIVDINKNYLTKIIDAHESDVTGIFVLGNSEKFVSCDNSSIKVWDILSGALLQTIFSDSLGKVISILYDSKNDILIAYGFENTLKAWSLKENQLLFDYKPIVEITDIDQPDSLINTINTNMATGYIDKVSLSKQMKVKFVEDILPSCIAANNCNLFGVIDKFKNIGIYDITNGELIKELDIKSTERSYISNACDLNSSCSSFLFGDIRGGIYEWNLYKKQTNKLFDNCIAVIGGERITTLSYFYDGLIFYGGGSRFRIGATSTPNLETSKLMKTKQLVKKVDRYFNLLELQNLDTTISCMATCSEKGMLVAGTSSGTVRIYDIYTSKILKEVNYARGIWDIGVSMNNRYLCIGYGEESIEVLDIEDEYSIVFNKSDIGSPVIRILFNNNYESFVVISKKATFLLNLTTLKLSKLLESPSNYTISAAAMHADDLLLGYEKTLSDNNYAELNLNNENSQSFLSAFIDIERKLVTLINENGIISTLGYK